MRHPETYWIKFMDIACAGGALTPAFGGKGWL
jgi:hypothetical protein